jgi:hypothetical protein
MRLSRKSGQSANGISFRLVFLEGGSMSIMLAVHTACLGVLAGLLSGTTLRTEPSWRELVNEQLPRLGHRNWIVIADSAYPLHSRPGIETVATGAEQGEVLEFVLTALKKSSHVRPIIYLDAELPYVAEQDAKGITAYRAELKSLLGGATTKSLPHEAIIATLDKSAETYHVLILKTNLRLPYTSVFVELDCGYWSPEAEQGLRNAMQRDEANDGRAGEN